MPTQIFAMNSVEFSIAVEGPERDVLIAKLAEAGCEGFEELERYLNAYAPESNEIIERVESIIREHGLISSHRIIESQNWNAIWEASFDAVIVPGFCTVRAPFHLPADTPLEIVILPKMAFGTGHHATTRLMMQAMRDIDFDGREVLDFGTGTGILAILARKLGATTVMAIDIDEWSVRNAIENVSSNGANSITVLQGDISVLQDNACFDVILANINRNVLLESMPALRKKTNPGGTLLLSGILQSDQTIISEAAASAGFTLSERFQEAEWTCFWFTAQ